MKIMNYFNKADKNAGKESILNAVMTTGRYVILSVVGLAILVAFDGLTPKKASAIPFGQVTTQFALNNGGYDTAAGNDPNLNYFLTTAGIEVRDAAGNLTGTILSPGGVDAYGLASDGTDLFASDMAGQSIYKNVGGNLWDAGIGVDGSDARGLAVSDLYLFEVIENGAKIRAYDKATGATAGTFNTPVELYGLDYIPTTNELVGTDGYRNAYRMFLTSNQLGIDNTQIVAFTGLGVYNGVGIGYNRSSGNLIINDGEGAGKYSGGVVPASVPEPSTMMLLGLGLTGLLGLGSQRRS